MWLLWNYFKNQRRPLSHLTTVMLWGTPCIMCLGASGAEEREIENTGADYEGEKYPGDRD